MKCNYISRFFTSYLEIHNQVIWNNHESSVLMNYRGRYVLNQGMNCECVHIVVQMSCYSKCGIVLHEFNPHLPQPKPKNNITFNDDYKGLHKHMKTYL
jgi:hypothetical protein